MGLVWNPQGVLRGDRSGEACFTTLLAGPGLPATWPLHLERLSRDAGLLGLDMPDQNDLLSAILQALDAGRTPHGRVRIELVAMGGSPLHGPATDTAVRLLATAIPDADPGPVTLQTLPSGKGQAGPLSTVKLPMMAEHFVLRRQAQAAGFGDALLTTAEGLWCEAATANLLVGLENGDLATPGRRAQPLPGTTLAALRANVPIDDMDLDGRSPVVWAVLLNAVWGVRVVAAIDGRPLAEPPAKLVELARRRVRPAT